METVTVAAVQATPEFLDRDATVQKVVRLTKEAAGQGARLIVFPETFIPTYPDWVWRAAAWVGPFEALTARLREESVQVPSSATDEIGKAAKRAKAYLSVRERARRWHDLQRPAAVRSRRRAREEAPEADADRRRADGMGVRRRVRPRPGRDALRARRRVDLLGEPDAARADRDLAKGVDIWAAPTWDNDENWIANLRHIAREGRVYVIGVCTLLRGSDIPDDIPGRELWGGEEDWANPGWSAIVDPEGQLLAGPLVEEEGILTAEMDAEVERAARYKFDPVGHYGRPDVFTLVVNDAPKRSVTSE